MTVNTAIADRIARRLRVLALSERRACLAAGLGVDAIRDIRRGRSPRVETLARLAGPLRCSVQWLVTGIATDATEGTGEGTGPADTGEAGQRLVAIFEAQVRDGTVGQPNGARAWYLPESLVTHGLDADPRHLRLVAVEGDSLVPELSPGDWVMVDTACTTPSPPGLFWLWDGLTAVLRRVEVFATPPRARLIATNPTYGTGECALDDLRILGRVVWTTHRV